LPTNIRLGWKGLPGTSALPYYKKVVTYGRKEFYNIGPRSIIDDKENKVFKRRHQRDVGDAEGPPGPAGVKLLELELQVGVLVVPAG